MGSVAAGLRVRTWGLLEGLRQVCGVSFMSSAVSEGKMEP